MVKRSVIGLVSVVVALPMFLLAPNTSLPKVLLPQTAAASSGAKQLSLIAIPHEDDELDAWSLIENSPDNYPIFIYMTLGEATAYCQTDVGPTGYQPQYGEHFPGNGAWIQNSTSPYINPPNPTSWPSPSACTNARVWSSLNMLARMSYDPANGQYPGMYDPTIPYRPSNIYYPCFSGEYNSKPNCATLLVGPAGAVVFFNLGDRNTAQANVDANVPCGSDPSGVLQACDVLWAVQNIAVLAGQYGIPNLPVHNIIGDSYRVAGLPNCVQYDHPVHRAIHKALWDYTILANTQQLGRTCTSDPDAAAVHGGRTAYVDQGGESPTGLLERAYWVSAVDTCGVQGVGCGAFDPLQQATDYRVGPSVQEYGWLANPYYMMADNFYNPNAQQGAVGNTQAFWCRSGPAVYGATNYCSGQ